MYTRLQIYIFVHVHGIFMHIHVHTCTMLIFTYLHMSCAQEALRRLQKGTGKRTSVKHELLSVCVIVRCYCARGAPRSQDGPFGLSRSRGPLGSSSWTSRGPSRSYLGPSWGQSFLSRYHVQSLMGKIASTREHVGTTMAQRRHVVQFLEQNVCSMYVYVHRPTR